VSVETASVNGHAHVLGVTGKLAQLPPFRETAQFVPSRLDPAEERSVADLAARAVAALGVARGLAHTEIKLTPEGPRIIEVNGRLGGHIDELYARAYGLDMLAIELALAAGTTPALHSGPAEQVYYQYQNLGPADGGTFIRVDGAAAVRAVPGVTGYRALVPRGAPVPRGVSTTELDLLTGHADNHDAMLTSIDKALAELTFTIADDTASRAWQASREGLRCPG
jgi:biotin carboxylase